MVEMLEMEFGDKLRRYLQDNIEVVQLRNGVLVTFPFQGAEGDRIEIALTRTDHGLVVDDLGHTAGLLFAINEHARDAAGHSLVKSLSGEYRITMDYDYGLLARKLASWDDIEGVLEFLQVVVSAQTTVPCLHRRSESKKRGSRLGAQLGRDIRPLRWRGQVQRLVEVPGLRDSWLVEYKYAKKAGSRSEEICIVASDLTVVQPKQKAEHVLALATDLLRASERPELRIVYGLNGHGPGTQPQRAAALIEGYQSEIGYQSFNYSNQEQREHLKRITEAEIAETALI